MEGINIEARTINKRLMGEAKLLNKNPLHYCTAYADENNIKKWYFIFIGQHDNECYNGGHYIGEIQLSDKYPLSPPDFIFYTPNGRFETNRKICLTITGYHKESWNPSINIKTMLGMIYSIFIADDTEGLGHIVDVSGKMTQQRKQLRDNSIAFNKKNYSKIYADFDFTHLHNGERDLKVKEDVIETVEPAIEMNAPIIETKAPVIETNAPVVENDDIDTDDDEEEMEINYDAYTKKELIDLCKKRGLKTTTKMTKAVLINLLKN